MSWTPMTTDSSGTLAEIRRQKGAKPLVVLAEDQLSDVLNISEGVFAPLDGFLDAESYTSVLEDDHLPDGRPWSMPITLPVDPDLARKLARFSDVELADADGVPCARLEISDVFQVDWKRDIPRMFGTSDRAHPGVAMEMARSSHRVGGRVSVTDPSRLQTRLTERYRSPKEVREDIGRRNFKTVVGFQTRNPPHLAHEHHQRRALHFSDGLFIHPLIGWKKAGDFTQRAIIEGYRVLLEEFFPEDRVLFGTLGTGMRYAGPREAVFHALIRKNYGCTHFIVGRDHAGVGSYYGLYEAQEKCLAMPDLGIEILAWSEPYYCCRCSHMVTANECRHDGDSSHVVRISGTEIREQLSRKKAPPETMMRGDVAEVLLDLERNGKAFCD